MAGRAAAALERLVARGMRPGIPHVRALLDSLGAPDRRYPILLVGGTNGKGSVSAMAAAGLAEAGLTVGLFTSPHLVDVRERFVVDGAAVSDAELDAAWARVAPAVDTSGATYYEATTALALVLFADRGIDAAVLEVGMGGRLDAVNATDPVVSAVVLVALDHVEHLGRTVEAIAVEKAAIARRRRPLVTGATGPALETIRAEARRHGARLTEVSAPRRAWRIRLRGRHQERNAEVALAAARAFLFETGRPVVEAALVRGIEAASWPGRFEVLDRPGGPVVLDGAHNLDGAAALAAALASEFPGVRWTAVFNVRGPRDPAGIAAPLAPAVDRWIVPRLSDPQGCAPDAVAGALHAAGAAAETAADVPAALRAAAPPAVVFGSLYLVGEAMATLGACPTGSLWPRRSRSPGSSSSPPSSSPSSTPGGATSPA